MPVPKGPCVFQAEIGLHFGPFWVEFIKLNHQWRLHISQVPTAVRDHLAAWRPARSAWRVVRFNVRGVCQGAPPAEDAQHHLGIP